MVEVAGPIHTMSVGAHVVVETGATPDVPCKVVGFSGAHALLVPFGPLEGVRRGRATTTTSRSPTRCARSSTATS